jgi:hypothetical protein
MFINALIFFFTWQLPYILAVAIHSGSSQGHVGDIGRAVAILRWRPNYTLVFLIKNKFH